MKVLPNSFYTVPKYSEMTMTKEDLRELLLATNGWIMACGQSWNIDSEHIGADIYRVRLVKRPFGRPE